MHVCFFSGIGLERKKEGGVRLPKLSVLTGHAFAAMGRPGTTSVSSSDPCQLEECEGLGSLAALPCGRGGRFGPFWFCAGHAAWLTVKGPVLMQGQLSSALPVKSLQLRFKLPIF